MLVPEEGANQTRQLPAGTTTVTLDLSAFDDQTVQLRYESPRGGSLQVARLRVKETILNGNQVIVWALVVNGELLTAFVPSVGGGASPAGSQYEDVYDREKAIEYILEEIRGAAGEDALTKIDEFEPIIEEINEGETVE